MTPSESHLAYHISVKGMIINLLLFAAKGITGLLIHSVSLLSDAVHSLTDIISTAVVLAGIKISCKPADRSHPYGHDKIECMIAFLLGLMLFAIGAIIGWEGIHKLHNPPEISGISYLLNTFALVAALVSIFAKEWMYRFTIKCARQIGSSSMAADAWHHRSDAISSIGSLIGVIGIRFDFGIIDVLACFVISVFIFKAAYSICADACKKMIDTAGDYAIVTHIEHIILDNKDVLSLDMLKTRQFGSRLYVDIEVTLDRRISFEHSHNIAHSIHDSIENTITEVKHCMVHVSPSH
ncbi:MAG: cation transporter [Ruminococcaceae bacterium]|nr:cation transporter [Oscillospiraceae bacterium]